MITTVLVTVLGIKVFPDYANWFLVYATLSIVLSFLSIIGHIYKAFKDGET